MSLVSSVKSMVVGDRHGPVKISGTVTDVFGHRFVVETPTGRFLTDIGPNAAESIEIEPHDRVSMEGEQRPTEIKVHRIAINGGEMHDTRHGDPKHDKDREHQERQFGPTEAAQLAKAEGYELIGDLRPHKKHFEALATKGDTKFEIHVHRDGRHEAKRELGTHEQR